MAIDNREVRTSGKGFLDSTSGLKVLHIQGSAYEHGYQHGFLLAEEIAQSVPQVLAGAAAVISKTISCSFETAQKKLALGKKAAEPHMPDVIREEIRGIAEGVSDGGGNGINTFFCPAVPVGSPSAPPES